MTIRAAVTILILSGFTLRAVASPDDDLLHGLTNSKKVETALLAGANPSLLVCYKGSEQFIVATPEACPTGPVPAIWAVIHDGYLIPADGLAESIRLLAQYGAKPSYRPVGATGKASAYTEISYLLWAGVLPKQEQIVAVSWAMQQAGYQMSVEEAKSIGYLLPCRNGSYASRCDTMLEIFGRIEEGNKARAEALAKDERENRARFARDAQLRSRLERDAPLIVQNRQRAQMEALIRAQAKRPVESPGQAATRLCGIMDLECRARVLTGR